VKGGEMTQTLYAHMNEIKIKKKGDLHMHVYCSTIHNVQEFASVWVPLQLLMKRWAYYN
jgi:hypothetical protein